MKKQCNCNETEHLNKGYKNENFADFLNKYTLYEYTHKFPSYEQKAILTIINVIIFILIWIFPLVWQIFEKVTLLFSIIEGTLIFTWIILAFRYIYYDWNSGIIVPNPEYSPTEEIN